jgi:hypothetical protein
LHTFDDGLYLLDGHFNQLRSFYVDVNMILSSDRSVNNTVEIILFDIYDVDTFKKLLKQPKICQRLKRLLDEIHPIVGEHNDPHFIEHMTTIVDVSDVDNVCFNINLTLVISRQQFFFALTENINCNIIA